MDLGFLLLKQPGRAKEAERAFRDAIEAGDDVPEAQEALGYLLQQDGREQEAESAYRNAIAAGSDKARVRLAQLLSDLPGREKDAEVAFWDVAKQGDQDVWPRLAQILVMRGTNGDLTLDEWQAQMIDQQVDANNPYALFVMGFWIVLSSGETDASGYDMLRRAAAAGVEMAAHFLRILGHEDTPEPGSPPDHSN